VNLGSESGILKPSRGVLKESAFELAADNYHKSPLDPEKSF
jgi:hypothetical protein